MLAFHLRSMFTPALNRRSLSPFRRFIAAVGVALVLLLSAASVHPVLHAHLHDADTHAHVENDTCAVVLFASGITLALAAVFVVSVATHDAPSFPVPRSISLLPPRYLRRPERGPPLR